MPAKVTPDELIERLPELLDRVHTRGEGVAIERNGEVIAHLTPAERPSITWREFVVLLRELPPPDDRFADDLEAVLKSQKPIELPPWPS